MRVGGCKIYIDGRAGWRSWIVLLVLNASGPLGAITRELWTSVEKFS